DLVTGVQTCALPIFVIQLRLGTVLRHREVEPAVSVVVSERRAPLVPIHGDPGDLPGHRHQRAAALPEQQQSATGVVAPRPYLGEIGSASCSEGANAA